MQKAFFQKFEIISPSTNRGGIEGIFLLLKKRINIFQYDSESSKSFTNNTLALGRKSFPHIHRYSFEAIE